MLGLLALNGAILRSRAPISAILILFEREAVACFEPDLDVLLEDVDVHISLHFAVLIGRYGVLMQLAFEVEAYSGLCM